MDHAVHSHDEALHHQFEDLEQQNESYMVGMWVFLASEVMFFGALFLMYNLYRAFYQQDFYVAHEHLNVPLGAANTMVLLVSSFSMALAVHFAQLKDRMKVLMCLATTIGCAVVFLGVKAYEYHEKFADHLYPGVGFTQSLETFHGASVNLNHAQLFYALYFTMTGLHAVHILAGIVVISALAWLWFKKAPSVSKDFVPTELVGLYWHFVDVVWIFLFPLFYLQPMPHK